MEYGEGWDSLAGAPGQSTLQIFFFKFQDVELVTLKIKRVVNVTFAHTMMRKLLNHAPVSHQGGPLYDQDPQEAWSADSVQNLIFWVQTSIR